LSKSSVAGDHAPLELAVPGKVDRRAFEGGDRYTPDVRHFVRSDLAVTQVQHRAMSPMTAHGARHPDAIQLLSGHGEPVQDRSRRVADHGAVPDARDGRCDQAEVPAPLIEVVTLDVGASPNTLPVTVAARLEQLVDGHPLAVEEFPGEVQSVHLHSGHRPRTGDPGYPQAKSADPQSNCCFATRSSSRCANSGSGLNWT
jgi:hypothetical protein